MREAFLPVIAQSCPRASQITDKKKIYTVFATLESILKQTLVLAKCEGFIHPNPEKYIFFDREAIRKTWNEFLKETLKISG